jgi:hypothetical protein
MAQNTREQIAAVERTGSAIIASQIASAAVLNNNLETLGYVTEAGFKNLAGGMVNVSRQVGEMGVYMNMSFARLESSVQQSANAICQKLDAISDVLQRPSLTQSREYLGRASVNYNKGSTRRL